MGCLCVNELVDTLVHSVKLELRFDNGRELDYAIRSGYQPNRSMRTHCEIRPQFLYPRLVERDLVRDRP
jgi:hypothetical protein